MQDDERVWETREIISGLRRDVRSNNKKKKDMKGRLKGKEESWRGKARAHKKAQVREEEILSEG